MGFHEKSAWACLLGILLVFIPYFVVVLQNPMAFVGVFIVAVFVLVAFLSSFHIFNAIMSPSIRRTGDVPPHDELDRLIEMRAAKISGIVLAVTVIVWCFNAMIGVPLIGVQEIANSELGGGPKSAQFAIPVNQALFAIHLLFAGFVIANVVYYGSIIVGYRRLAHA